MEADPYRLVCHPWPPELDASVGHSKQSIADEITVQPQIFGGDVLRFGRHQASQAKVSQPGAPAPLNFGRGWTYLLQDFVVVHSSARPIRLGKDNGRCLAWNTTNRYKEQHVGI